MKWVVFAVTLPLLPIVCKVLADWIDGGQADWSVSKLFGDGELLVIATVIAAAGIGDLVFDLRRNRRRRSFRDASAIALALVCVVVSVTMYALVTLKREQLTPGLQTVANSVEIQESEVAAQQAQMTNLERQLSTAQAERAQALAAYQKEITGKNGDPPGSSGPLAKVFLARYQNASQVAASIQNQLQLAESRLSQGQDSLTKTRLSANKALSTSKPFDGHRAGEASIWMFVLGLLAGLNCLLAGSAHTHRRKRQKLSETTAHNDLAIRKVSGFEADEGGGRQDLLPRSNETVDDPREAQLR